MQNCLLLNITIRSRGNKIKISSVVIVVVVVVVVLWW